MPLQARPRSVEKPLREKKMSTARLSARREIRIPEDVAKKLKLRSGSSLELVLSGDVLLVIPAKRISKAQQYFYTEEWQRREHEADEAIAKGDVLGPFDDADSAIEALRSDKA